VDLVFLELERFGTVDQYHYHQAKNEKIEKIARSKKFQYTLCLLSIYTTVHLSVHLLICLYFFTIFQPTLDSRQYLILISLKKRNPVTFTQIEWISQNYMNLIVTRDTCENTHTRAFLESRV
jgi:hypothetical protein